MVKIKKFGKIFWIIITVIPILGIIFGLFEPIKFFEVQTEWRDKISSFGLLAPLIFIALQAFQVIIAPISHYTIGVLGGFIFGPWIGGLLNYIGRCIGHCIAFEISQRFGRPLLKRLVKESTIKRYEYLVSGGSKTPYQSIILFLIYFLPLFPDDEISYLVGLSKMPRKPFWLANIFGHVGGSLSLAYIGSGINTRDFIFWVLFIATFLAFPALWLSFNLRARSEYKIAQKNQLSE
ncbi:TVP38/TMEM64 family protein [bacterium]|nr:TVP38/TMEM64 family protein [bacterium]